MVQFPVRPLRLMMRLLIAVIFATATLAVAKQAHAEILYEGYSKILLDGVHVGYFVQRYSFDVKKKEFTSAHFLKTQPVAGNLSESLVARADDKFSPLGYQYTEVVGDKAKTIDAVFKNGMMTATINVGGKQEIAQRKIAKGQFLSSFLPFVMLAGKEGIKKGINYQYEAIAEEDTVVHSGNALIASEETYNGLNVFKVLNTFKGTMFQSFITYKGEIVATKSPLQKISSELVATAAEATAGMPFNSSTLTRIFGSVPKGTDNPISRRAPPEAPSSTTEMNGAAASTQKQKLLDATPTPSPEAPGSAKKEGVPQGQGITVKGAPSGK